MVFGSFNPSFDSVIGITHSFFRRIAVAHAARQIGNARNEAIIAFPTEDRCERHQKLVSLYLLRLPARWRQ